MSDATATAERQFHDLLDRLQQGDKSAETEFYKRYAEEVCRFAERRINQQFRRRFGPETITDLALWSVMRRTGEGQYEFKHERDLRHMLRTVASNKIRHEVKRHTRKQRDVRRTLGIDNLQPAIHERIVLEAEELAKRLESCLKTLKPRDARIFQLRHGHEPEWSSCRIAAEIGCSRSMVDRVLKRIHEDLRESLGEEMDA